MIAIVFMACLATAVAGKPWFVVNEDNDHFFKCDASLMTERGLSDYIDYICRGKVTHVFFCVNGQRTSYDSKTWEPIWAGLDDQARSDTATRPDGTRDRWAVNCKALFDAGIDPYAVWIRRCREKGVKPWVSMRMNDIHGSENPKYFRNTTWYKAHPEFRLDPTGANGMLQQLDYAHKEVRDYTMAQVKEIAARWPADGVELDWMRFGFVFKPNEERENARILDGFMREASAVIRAAGKQVAVRVPYDHEVCEEFGFNVVRWAKEGLVDVVIPAPFINSASDLPVGKWTEALAGTKVRLVPDLGCEVRGADRRRVPTVYRGVAESFFAQGASGVYFYNLPYKSTALYSSDSRGKAWCKDLDVAAELYTNGILPDDLRNLDIDCPPMVHDWPHRPMRNTAKWDAFFAGEAPRYPALLAALDAKSAAGGGRVEVEGTVWCDGPLRLKSGVELHFADGARLVFTDNPARYLPVVQTSYEGIECFNYSPLVYTFGQTNVAITGRGTIEPRVDRWIDWYNLTPDYRVSLRKVYDWCCDGEPVANRDLTKLAGMNVRPQLVQFNRCGNVRLEGFRVRQSPFWVLHFLLCDGVVVKDVDVIGLGRNNDGVDLEMTKNVLVDGCSFREGDDAIVVKAGRNHDGWRLATPSENIEIRNCRVSRGNAILGVGSEMSGGVRNVWMHDCVFDGFGGSLLELKTNERRGGFIRDVRVENVSAPGVLLGSVLTIATDCHYQWREFPTREVRVTEISDITMRNVRAFKACRVLNVCGDRRNPVRNLTVENVTAERVKEKDRIENVKGFRGK